MSKHFTILLAAGVALGLASQIWAQGTNRYDTGGNYTPSAPTNTNYMKWVAQTNSQNPSGDDNIIWSKDGRYLATDRQSTNPPPPNASPKLVNLIGFDAAGNHTNLGPRCAFTNTQTVYADITDFTCNNDRIIYVNATNTMTGIKRLISCSVTGALDVKLFLTNNSYNISSPSIIYDPIAKKERLLFMAAYTGGPPMDAVRNLYTVLFDSGGVPDWANRQALTAFTSNEWIASAKWCPELGTNLQPLVNRYAITKAYQSPPNQPSKRGYLTFHGVSAIISGNPDFGDTNPPTSLNDPRFDFRITNASGGSQVTWTFDGKFLMCGINTNPAATNEQEAISGLFSIPSMGTNRTPIPFPTPPQVAPLNKKWPTVSPNGMKAAFCVNAQVVLLPLQCEQTGSTNAGTTNIITDGSYTKVEIPGSALSTNSGVTNFTFTVMEPTEVDTNNFPTNFVGNAREFGVSGVSSQFNFETNVTMSLHYEDSDVPTNMSATNMSLFLYNPQSNAAGKTCTWTQVQSTVDTNTHYVTSTNIQHFSIYALGKGYGPPAAPTNLTASRGTSPDRVALTWDATAITLGYIVYRGTNAATNSAAQIGASVTNNYPDTTAGHNTNYFYWVAATNENGISAWSASNNGFLGLSAPAALTASEGTHTDKVAVSWSASTGAVGYILFRGTNDDTNSAAQIADVPASTNFDDTNAVPGSNYYYWAKATNDLNTSDWSPSHLGYCASANAGIAILGTNNATIANGEGPSADKGTDFGSLTSQGAARTNLLAITNSGTALLTIIGIATNGAGAERFHVAGVPAAVAGGTASNFFLIFDAAAEGVHTAQVSIANASTNNPYTFGVKGTLLLAPSITAEPQSLTNYLGSTATFTVAATGTVPLLYQWQKNTANIGSATNATYSITSVLAGDAGNYRCLVSNIVGAVTSATASLTVLTPPDAPASLAASDGTYTDKVAVAWAPSAGALGYIVYRGVSPATNSAAPIGISAATNYDDLTATREIVYYYWVAATNAAGVSGLSPSNTGWRAGEPIPPLPAPTGVAASDGTYWDKVRVTWNAVTNATTYVVFRSLTNDPATASQWGFTDITTCDDTAATNWPETALYYWVKASNAQSTSVFSASAQGSCAANITTKRPLSGDFDGDSRNDLALYQESSGIWSLKLSASGYSAASVTLGGAGYQPVAKDFDGDGKADPSVYDTATGNWEIMLSGSGYVIARLLDFGGLEYQCLAGDFDGDLKADPAVYGADAGTLLVKLSGSGYGTAALAGFGAAGCISMALDFDGDGKADPAIYQPATGAWTVKLSGSGYTPASIVNFGGPSYLLVSGMYDNDTRADAAIYNPANGNWTVLLSASAYITGTLWGFGAAGDVPVAGDFDGDGKVDPALYRAATSTWLIKPSGSGYSTVQVQQ